MLSFLFVFGIAHAFQHARSRQSINLMHASHVRINPFHYEPRSRFRFDGKIGLSSNDETNNYGSVSLALQLALRRHFSNVLARPKAPRITAMYDIEQAYNGRNPYWVSAMKADRFPRVKEQDVKILPLLFRPIIVNEIKARIDDNLNDILRNGLLVTGPQGVGKSFSLVNTVIKLESTGEYLVTFIPDCDKWKSALDLVKAIAASFGATTTEIPEMNKKFSGDDAVDNIDLLIDAIATCLAEMEPRKHWVFVFDQINKLFIKDIRPSNSISALLFPYSMIKDVMRAGRVTSVISASANNEAAVSGKHDQFVDYYHQTSMNRLELSRLFDKISGRTKSTMKLLNSTIALTDGVPYYVSKFVGETYKRNATDFYLSEMGLMFSAWGNLYNQVNSLQWKQICENMVTAYFGLTYKKFSLYDKKYFVSTNINGRSKIVPLFPMVIDALRDYFWDSLLHDMNRNVAERIRICKAEGTTGDVLSRLFELSLIQMSLVQESELRLDQGVVLKVPRTIVRFEGLSLPLISEEAALYVPYKSTFPAIDFVWKIRNYIIGVQVHTSTQDDKTVKFEEMCTAAGWTEQHPGNVYHLYLCQEPQFKKNVPDFTPSPNGLIKVFARTVDEIEGLNSLKWWY
jgi:hypothetical protein